MKRKKNILVIASLCAFLYTGCSSFIADEDLDKITVKYQAGEYILLSDVTRNGVTLAKGTIVKLTIVAGDEWVKVYAYDKNEELLMSKRQILIYMFEDDFPEKEFKEDLLDAEIVKVVKLYDSSVEPKKKQKKESGKNSKK